jgi:hypothetical protein
LMSQNSCVYFLTIFFFKFFSKPCNFSFTPSNSTDIHPMLLKAKLNRQPPGLYEVHDDAGHYFFLKIPCSSQSKLAKSHLPALHITLWLSFL